MLAPGQVITWTGYNTDRLYQVMGMPGYTCYTCYNALDQL